MKTKPEQTSLLGATAGVKAPPHTFSFFDSFGDKHPEEITIAKFAEIIQGGEYLMQIGAVRSASSKPERDALKKKLPAVTISGVFEGGHKAEHLKDHSGLICMDFDAKDNPCLLGTVEEYRDKISKEPFCKLAFVSAGGQGLAVICAIRPLQHEASFLTLRDHFKEHYDLTADESCKDVCRLRFVSWDDAALLNEQAKPVSPSPCYVETVDKHSNLQSLQPLQLLHNIPTTTAERMKQSQAFLKGFDLSETAPLYRRIVEKNFVAKVAGRNDVVVRQATFLFRATSEAVALHWIQAFYWKNAATFNDPLDVHLQEARAHWASCLAGYPDELNNSERECYLVLSKETERTLFRICRDLAFNDKNGCKDGLFPLSAEQCRQRLGLNHDIEGSRLLSTFHKQYGIIDLHQAGQKRAKGQQPRANVYRWMLC